MEVSKLQNTLIINYTNNDNEKSSKYANPVTHNDTSDLRIKAGFSATKAVRRMLLQSRIETPTFHQLKTERDMNRENV